MTVSPTRTTGRQAVRDHFIAATTEAGRLGHPIVASFSRRCEAATDPLDFFRRAAIPGDFRAYWEHPASGRALVAIGAARAIETAGDRRFRDAAAAIRADRATAAIALDDRTGLPHGLTYLGGFAFDAARAAEPIWRDFPAGLLILPEILLARHGGDATVTFNAVVGPGSAGETVADALLDRFEARALTGVRRHDLAGAASEVSWTETPSREQWECQVAAVARDIRAGQFEKVVLARRLAARAKAPFDVTQALGQLRESYPAAFVFAFGSGPSTFLGATPELLIRREGREIEATSLAGSAPRGRTAAEDEALANALLASAKDHVEHAIVARAIQEALAPLCDDLIAGPAPRLMRVRNVQHLYTPVRGRLTGTHSILELVERLHPTPAVGGYPRDLALAAIRERQELDRGWYAGPVGWVSASGDGEFGVAIRSALVRAQEAHLYAGCGLVADSDPAAEYQETLPKLRPMLDALGLGQ